MRARPRRNPNCARHPRTRQSSDQSECDGVCPDEIDQPPREGVLMSDHGAGLDRRHFLLGAVGVGAGAMLTACTGNKSKTAAASTSGAAATAGAGTSNDAPGTTVNIGFSSPAADHGWT